MAVVVKARLLAVFTGAALLACAGEKKPIELRVGLDPASADFGSVEVWGLPPSLRKALGQVAPQDEGWSKALTVKATSGDEAVPPLAGRYTIAKSGCLKFVPRFSPEGPLSYRIRLDPAALAKLAGKGEGSDTVQQWSFRLPGRPTPAPSTTIAAIYPSTTVVPANQLRWYVEFSSPMREGESAQYVHLVDRNGREVDGSFLTVKQELWNPDRTRITLFFDMGRVKRAIRTRVEKGPVLKPGQHYTLRIDAGWHDARGALLMEGLVHRFQAGPEDHEPVIPRHWSLLAPPIGSRGPLKLDFGEPLDHALASQLIAVTGSDDTAVPGNIRLRNHDREWQFTPEAPWLAGSYKVHISPALEDLAGNRVGHVFDADLRHREAAGLDTTPVILDFSPVGELSVRLIP